MAEKAKEAPGLIGSFIEVFSELYGVLYDTIKNLFKLAWEFISGVYKIVTDTIGMPFYEFIWNLIVILYDSLRGK